MTVKYNILKTEVFIMAKFCSKCGAQMDDNLMFCGNCGAQQGGAPVATAPAASPLANVDYKGILTGKADEKTNWLAALALPVLSLILFLLIFFPHGQQFFSTVYFVFHI